MVVECTDLSTHSVVPRRSPEKESTSPHDHEDDEEGIYGIHNNTTSLTCSSSFMSTSSSPRGQGAPSQHHRQHHRNYTKPSYHSYNHPHDDFRQTATSNSIMNLSDSLECSQDVSTLEDGNNTTVDVSMDHSVPDDPDMYLFDGEVPQTPMNRSLLEEDSDSDDDDEDGDALIMAASHDDQDFMPGGGVSDVELSPILKRHEDYDDDDDDDEVVNYEEEPHVVALDSDDPTADETSTSSSSSFTPSHHPSPPPQEQDEEEEDPLIPAPPTPLRQPMMPEFHPEPPQTPDLRHSCVGAGCPTAMTTTTTTTSTTTTTQPYGLMSPSSQPTSSPEEEDHTSYTNTPTSSTASSTKDGTSSTKTHPTSNKTHPPTQLSETPTNTSVLDAFLDTSTYSLHQVTESFTEAFCPPDDDALNSSKNALMESTEPPSFGSGSCGDVLHQYSDNTITLTKSIQHQLQSDFETLLGCGDHPTDDELVQVWRKDDKNSKNNATSGAHPPQPSQVPPPPIFQLPHKRASLQRRAMRIHQFRQEQEVFGTSTSSTSSTRRRPRGSNTKTNMPSLPLPLSTGPSGDHHRHPHCHYHDHLQQPIMPLRPRAKSQDDSQLEYSKMTLSPKRTSFTNIFDDLLDVPPVEELGKLMGTSLPVQGQSDKDIHSKKTNDHDDDNDQDGGGGGGYDSDPGEISHYVDSHKRQNPMTQLTADMSSTSLLDQYCEESTPKRLTREEQEALEEQQRTYVNQTPPFGGGDAHVQNAMNTTYTLKWLGTNTMVPVELPESSATLSSSSSSSSSSCASSDDSQDEKQSSPPPCYKMEKKLDTTPPFVRMWIERGTLLNFGQTCIEPQIMWRPIFADAACTQPNIANVPPESIRLMAICRILEVTEDHLNPENTLISMDKCFVLKNTKGAEYIFEASSVEERNEIVQLWKYAVARLASLAMVGEEETMAYEFFTADATLQGGQPIY